MGIRRRFAVGAAATLLVTVAPAAGAQEEHLTGLGRAREATVHGLEKSRGASADAPGQANRARGLDPERARGRERAAEAVQNALERAEQRGQGNGFGRGHAAEVHAILTAGGSPSELAGQHADNVHDLVDAYNALKANAGNEPD